jgi:hypothetical protein
VGSILLLALLAPDIVEATLAGHTDQALILERLGRVMPCLGGAASQAVAERRVAQATRALRASH